LKAELEFRDKDPAVVWLRRLRLCTLRVIKCGTFWFRGFLHILRTEKWRDRDAGSFVSPVVAPLYVPWFGKPSLKARLFLPSQSGLTLTLIPRNTGNCKQLVVPRLIKTFPAFFSEAKGSFANVQLTYYFSQNSSLCVFTSNSGHTVRDSR